MMSLLKQSYQEHHKETKLKLSDSLEQLKSSCPDATFRNIREFLKATVTEICNTLDSRRCKRRPLTVSTQSWYSAVSDANLLLSEPEILFSVTRPCTHRLTLNHLIILGKYFLYINALNKTTFAFSDFISLVQDKIEIEKYIAATLNGERGFLLTN